MGKLFTQIIEYIENLLHCLSYEECCAKSGFEGAETGNYIPQLLWEIITGPCP